MYDIYAIYQNIELSAVRVEGYLMKGFIYFYEPANTDLIRGQMDLQDHLNSWKF